MRTGLLIGLTVMLCVLTGVGLAAADSTVNYPNNPAPNNSLSLTISMGGGVLAFVFMDNGGSRDIFAQVVNARPLVRQKMERAPQDGQGTPAPPDSTSAPAPGTAR